MVRSNGVATKGDVSAVTVIVDFRVLNVHTSIVLGVRVRARGQG